MKTLKNIKINISRVFKVPSNRMVGKLIRLEGDFKSLSSLISTFGWKFVILSLGNIKKATSRIRLYHKFGTYVLVMNKRHGSEFVVKYLKACNLAVSKFLAGQPLSSLRELEPDLPLPRLSKSGLPAIIGTRDRRSISDNSVKVIRLWLTLFSLYRVIIIPSKAKLNTITDPYSGSQEQLDEMVNWMQHNAAVVLASFTNNLRVKVQESFSIGEAASPSNSKSWVGMLTDLSLLKNQPKLFNSLVFIMERTCKYTLTNLVIKLATVLPAPHSSDFELIYPMKDNFREAFSTASFEVRNSLGLGQLKQKAEPAGKMRVFAMVDSWTQTVLLPLHNYLMELLSRIPNDGTESHLAAFDRVRERSVLYKCSYGYDLSSATDRLPLSLQKAIIHSIFGKDFSDHWANLLVGRSYFLFGKQGTQQLDYSVGQPMGARSSFTMLGLTHHMIVQYAALMNSGLSFKKWEDRYEIVGDDIIIFDKNLADTYLLIMSTIGVPINMSKSVVSELRPVAEFVKRVSVNGKDVSPFSWKQFITENTYLGRINTTIALFSKDKSLAEHPVTVFNTVLKQAIYDQRSQKDILPLISLFMTYSIQIGMTFQEIIRILLQGKAFITNKSIGWESFDVNQFYAKLKRMIVEKVSPVDLAFHPDFTILEHYTKDLFAKRAYRIMKKYNVYKVEEIHQEIISHLYYGQFKSIDEDIKQLLDEWMELQDPIFGENGYPYYPNKSDDFRIENPENFSPEFIAELKLKLLAQYEDRYKNWFNYLYIEKFKDNPVMETYQFYQECQGKISFLDIHNRIDKVKLPVLLDAKDHTFLLDLHDVIKEVQHASGDSLRLNYEEPIPEKHYFPKIQRFLGWI